MVPLNLDFEFQALSSNMTPEATEMYSMALCLDLCGDYTSVLRCENPWSQTLKTLALLCMRIISSLGKKKYSQVSGLILGGQRVRQFPGGEGD